MKEEEVYALSPWGCMYCILKDYGIDVENVPCVIGQHMVEDFMELMQKQGYLRKADGNGETE